LAKVIREWSGSRCDQRSRVYRKPANPAEGARIPWRGHRPRGGIDL